MTAKQVPKTCTKCKEPKCTAEFNRDKSKTDGLCSWCRECRKKNKASYYERHKDEIKHTVQEWRDADKERSRNSYRNSRYKLKPQQFQEMLEAQDGRCAVCKQTFTESVAPHVDHDHSCCTAGSMTCGKCTRGLLCHACNKGLGYMRDDIESLQAAVEYLRDNGQHSRQFQR